MKKTLNFLIAIAILFIATVAEARIYVPIDQPADKKFPIAITDLVRMEGVPFAGDVAKDIPKVIRNDLELSGYFYVINKGAYLDHTNDINADTIDFSKWTSVGANAVIKGSVGRREGKIVVQLKLFDPYERVMLLGKQYTLEYKQHRTIAHKFSDDVMLALSGIRGIFNTKIAYSGIKTPKKKDIYVMDIDGENNDRVTKDGSVNMSPNWSPDSKKLTYISYAKYYPDVYLKDLVSGHARQLTNNNSTNITPTFSPDGGTIAFASGERGDIDIYFMNANGRDLRKITSSFGSDLSPSFSPDGNTLAYASEQHGKLHIYKLALNGSSPQRLTFVGYENDSPDWSPDGTKIVFSGRDQGTYDIFTMNSDGSNIQRLTVGSGSNEHPRWSPDGRYIVYSSTREGKPFIYMMRYDGANQTQLSKKVPGLMPSWSKWLD